VKYFLSRATFPVLKMLETTWPELLFGQLQFLRVLSRSWDGWPFSHNRHGLKIGAMPLWGDLGPHLAQCGLGRGLPLYQVASWSSQTLGHNSHGPKVGAAVPPFLWVGAGSPLWLPLVPGPGTTRHYLGTQTQKITAYVYANFVQLKVKLSVLIIVCCSAA